MKNLYFFTLCLIIFSACEYVEPNYEGVLMENYSKSGKADFSIQQGKVWTASAGTSLYQVPMFEQKGDCPELIVFAKDGGKYTVDPSYSYSPIRGKGVDILFAYKHLYGSSETFYDNIEGSILNPRVLNAYREEARKFSTDSLMNNVAKYENNVQTRLASEFSGKYFELSEVTSNLTPPASMSKAIESRNNQIQEANKLDNQKKTRESQIKIDIMNAETAAKIKILTANADVQSARLETEARELRNRSLTPAALRELELKKWDGAYPTTIVQDSKSPIISLPTSK